MTELNEWIEWKEIYLVCLKDFTNVNINLKHDINAWLCYWEASYFDQINMTKNGLKYDQKKFTPTNMNVGTWPKDY